MLQRVAVADVDLPFAGLAAQLPPALGELRNASRADRVTFGQKAAARVHGDTTVQRRLAFEARDAATALLDEPEVFDVEDLGDREAIVHLGAVDPCRLDAGHRVRALGRESRRLDLGEAVLLVEVRMVGGNTEPRDEHRCVGEFARSLRVDQDRGRGTVCLRAAVE